MLLAEPKLLKHYRGPVYLEQPVNGQLLVTTSGPYQLRELNEPLSFTLYRRRMGRRGDAIDAI